MEPLRVWDGLRSENDRLRDLCERQHEMLVQLNRGGLGCGLCELSSDEEDYLAKLIAEGA